MCLHYINLGVEMKSTYNLGIRYFMLYRLLEMIEAPDRAKSGASWIPYKPVHRHVNPGHWSQPVLWLILQLHSWVLMVHFINRLWAAVTNLGLTLNLRIRNGLNYWGKGFLILAKLVSTEGLNHFFPALNHKES